MPVGEFWHFLWQRCASVVFVSPWLFREMPTNSKLEWVLEGLALCVVFLVFLLKTSYCESDLEETRADPSSASSESAKYLSFTTSSVLEWLRSLNFVSYTNILPGYYVTFPANKDKRAYLNDTSGAFPLLYTLAGAGLVAYVSGYILTQIPIIDGLRRSTDYDDDLGFGRTYDEFDDEYDISAEYEYSYPDSFYSAASEPAGSFVRKKKKTIGERRSLANMKRRNGDPGTPGEQGAEGGIARRQKEPGLFDSITNAVKSIFNPNVKRSDTLLGGGLEAIVRRYDKYWKTRRSSAGKPNWELNLNTPRKQARSENLSKSSEETFIGPNLPSLKKEAGAGFYQDRGRVSDYYFDNESQ